MSNNSRVAGNPGNYFANRRDGGLSNPRRSNHRETQPAFPRVFERSAEPARNRRTRWVPAQQMQCLSRDVLAFNVNWEARPRRDGRRLADGPHDGAITCAWLPSSRVQRLLLLDVSPSASRPQPSLPSWRGPCVPPASCSEPRSCRLACQTCALDHTSAPAIAKRCVDFVNQVKARRSSD